MGFKSSLIKEKYFTKELNMIMLIMREINHKKRTIKTLSLLADWPNKRSEQNLVGIIRFWLINNF